MSLHVFTLLAILSLVGCSNEAPGGKRLLFIGNSLTASNDLPALVQEMFVAVKQPRPVVESILQANASLGDHWQNAKTRDRIKGNKWDYIILQQGPSSLAESQKEFMRDMETFKPWLKASGARAALFMVWPDTSRQRFFPQVRQAYASAAKSVDGIFLPAGLALQSFLEKDKSASLFTDSLHPNYLGTYLSAMVITARLTDVSPDQIPAEITWARQYTLKLTPQQHQACVAAARTALQDDGK